MSPFRRVAASLLGAELATVTVALVEAQGAEQAAQLKESVGRLALVWWGILAPLGLLLGAATTIALVWLDPEGPTSPRGFAAKVRSEPLFSRSRTAAFAPLLVFAGVVWLIGTAHLGRTLLSRGDPAGVGAELAFGATALMLALLAMVLAVVAPVRRALALGAGNLPQLVDPVATGGAAAAIAVLIFAFAIGSGDTGGEGESVLSIFGVLRRQELDLRPILHALAIAIGAWAGPLVVRPKSRLAESVALAIAALLPLGLVVPAGKLLDGAPPLARSMEAHSPLARISLALLRRASDRDHDGASGTFGGGDCDDRDPKRNPGALDVPGNGIDEDCSGNDTPLPSRPGNGAPARAGAGAGKEDTRADIEAALRAARAAIPPDLNLVLITVDTLRPDLGFLGYDLPISPNLDRLAQKSVVFERAYAPASYTGKSVGPVLIGKYPSETLRNGSHFNTYAPGNTFITERLAKSGLRTFGAASHWYFLPWSGITQGMAEFDLSAKPSSGQGDTDSSVTSKELTDASIKLLAQPENTSKRFFMWVHYFDPHAQYMAHPGAPSFLRPGATGGVAVSRAAYDGEVWFTDKNIGRLIDQIESAPYANRTAFILTADHGEAFAEHNMSWHGVELWESLIRVPLLIYVPGATPHRVSGRRSLVDLVPTILDVLDVPKPQPAADGQRELSGETMIADLFPKSPEETAENRDVYLDMPPGPNNAVRRALITGPGAGMKVIHFGGAQYSVFDLDQDPGELKDLASDRSVSGPLIERLQAMRGQLREIDVKPGTP